MPRQRDQEFAGDPRSPAAARSFAKAALAELLEPAPVAELLRDDVELVVSELVTNAIRAGSSSVRVSLELSPPPDCVVIRVSDDALGWPEPRESGDYDPGGRGLPLVSAISQTWGVRMAGGGKVVWAELAVPGGGPG